MTRTDSVEGMVALCIAHCAGLIDMVALPLWVGGLIEYYKYDPQKAGLLVTLFLGAAVLASLVIAPSFHRLASGRWLALAGFAVAGAAFYFLSVAVAFFEMAALHAIGGAAVGTALSMTHGTVARSRNPHRLFAICGTTQGLFALVFLSLMPQVMARYGAQVVFSTIAAVMFAGAFAALVAFPAVDPLKVSRAGHRTPKVDNLRALWGGILGLSCMSVVQSMSFSFFERVGIDHGFGIDRITVVLAALGFINLFPTAFAAILEKRIGPRTVLLLGPIVQALLSITIFFSARYVPFAIAGSIFVAVILFTHVFGFGMLAGLDGSGRALAATPAMMMTGAAIGPVLGGTLLRISGYSAIGIAAGVIGCIAVMSFSQLPRRKADAAIATAEGYAPH